MNRLKAVFTLLSFLFLVVGSCGFSFAYTFQYLSGGFTTEADALATNPLETDHPGPVLGDGFAEITAEVQRPHPTIPDVTASVSSSGLGEAFYADGASLDVFLYGAAEGFSNDPDGTLWSYGNATTKSSGVSFRIEPREGEQYGDSIMVSYSWDAGAEISVSGRAFLGEPGEKAAKITLRDGFGGPEGEVWSQPAVILSGEQYFVDNDSGFFAAQIGDVVSVFLSAKAEIEEVSGESDDLVTVANNTLLLEPVPIPGTFFLLACGLLGLIGTRRKLNKRQSGSPLSA